MTWIVVGVGAAATLGGAAMSASAAGNAANTQAASTRAGIAEQSREYDVARNDSAPYRDAGVSALDRLRNMLGIGGGGYGAMLPNGRTVEQEAVNRANGTLVPAGNVPITYYQDKDPALYNSTLSPYVDQINQENPTLRNNSDTGSLNKKFSISDFWNDPVVAASYQSGLDLGTKALKNAAPLTTGLDSGAALKELTKFGTDYTGNMAAGSQARYVGDQTNQFNRLAGMAGIGQQAVGQTTAAGTNMANNNSGLITAQGNASAAGSVAGANAWGNGLSSVSNFWNQQRMMKSLQGGGAYTPSNYNTSFMGPNGYNPEME